MMCHITIQCLRKTVWLGYTHWDMNEMDDILRRQLWIKILEIKVSYSYIVEFCSSGFIILYAKIVHVMALTGSDFEYFRPRNMHFYICIWM